MRTTEISFIWGAGEEILFPMQSRMSVFPILRFPHKGISMDDHLPPISLRVDLPDPAKSDIPTSKGYNGPVDPIRQAPTTHRHNLMPCRAKLTLHVSSMHCLWNEPNYLLTMPGPLDFLFQSGSRDILNRDAFKSPYLFGSFG